MAFVAYETSAAQLIVPSDKMLNVSGSFEKSTAAFWYTVTLPVAVKPPYDAVKANWPASWRSSIVVFSTVN